MENYFTDEEIALINYAFSDLRKSKLFVTRSKSGEIQKDAFFDKATLWTAVKRVILALYIEKLKRKELFLEDVEGRKWTLEEHIPPKEVGDEEPR